MEPEAVTSSLSDFLLHCKARYFNIHLTDSVRIELNNVCSSVLQGKSLIVIHTKDCQDRTPSPQNIFTFKQTL